MNELSLERSPSIIAAEINSIKEQTRKMVLFNSIEIGRRLVEAKTMIGHGEWGEWLEKSVDYSQRTASNLMRIFEEYGSNQITFFCDNAKSQALANLSYTQAVALLGIPPEDREAFIEEHNIDDMSTRELQQAIKEKQELEERLREVESNWIKDRSNAESSKRIADEKAEEVRELLEEKQSLKSDVKTLQETLEKERRHSKDEAERLAGLLQEAKDSGASDEMVSRLQAELKEARNLVDKLTKELDEPVEVTAAEVIEKVPEDVERELEELRERNKELEAKASQPIGTAPIRFKLHFDSLVKGFGDLLRTLEEIDAGEHDKYKNAVKGLLGKMSERL
ncbi:chromosome partition protein Smc [Desulfosporosinus acididurans]|uniref:Chromosome partition protein Smc n=1 Tax=Desulfosporosinus acididurans TaxID=476652 RepID=A0A0J1IPV4_9FIRM|nr:DUF3102 domain-containing protein [Desulfosporosinus acididurans]KLU66726.1 chromosome partition protein Smc [Desulfosporosinus acididurans]